MDNINYKFLITAFFAISIFSWAYNANAEPYDARERNTIHHQGSQDVHVHPGAPLPPGVHPHSGPGVHVAPGPGVRIAPGPGVHVAPGPGVRVAPGPGVQIHSPAGPQGNPGHYVHRGRTYRYVHQGNYYNYFHNGSYYLFFVNGAYYNYFYNGAYYRTCREVPGYWDYGHWVPCSMVCE